MCIFEMLLSWQTENLPSFLFLILNLWMQSSQRLLLLRTEDLSCLRDSLVSQVDCSAVQLATTDQPRPSLEWMAKIDDSLELAKHKTLGCFLLLVSDWTLCAPMSRSLCIH